MNEVFHAGERAIQQQTGEAHLADSLKGLIAPAIPRGAIRFVEQQSMAIVGSRNVAGELWASLLVGQPGFVRVPDPGLVVFDTRKLISHPADLFFSNIQDNPQVGSLFIELATRKRLRVNGAGHYDGTSIQLEVAQAYPNCPKYIQRRVISMPEYFEAVKSITKTGEGLTTAFIDWIQEADTLFVSSASAQGDLDVSHRGGNPGFVQVIDHQVLKIPDYPGNSLFNTFGNIVENPAVGLLFVDFNQRQTLQLTGTVQLLFDQNSETDLLRTKGTGRYWLFRPLHWIHTIDHHQVDWQLLDYSPYNP
ncbi:pyridoxamine 5'-phosphate oxidase family protein [Paraflavitalea pollutisoli]|uniref:pyridoxamine 5'-phosphate oxidase family protein n=1 Tax=Paraflavitalea pollutisoli TaxID=3034143 RepID=UPI0023ED16B1|nr:pyridoxamine 5'-phosphate oxidase family protein [Paraflavitalea sp. H1-2-19X]